VTPSHGKRLMARQSDFSEELAAGAGPSRCGDSAHG
jgi:hypothetical protein